MKTTEKSPGRRQIKVIDDLSIPEAVYVRTTPEGVIPPTCECQIDVMDPQTPVNMPLDFNLKIDGLCGKIVTWEKNDAYNQHFGFSGYDEYHDDEPRAEEDCE